MITENWEEENPQVQREYSFEEKRRLKALVDGEEYNKWEKENRLWEIEDDLVPLNEDEEKQKARMRLRTRIEQLNLKPLTEKEERLKSYLEYLAKSPGPDNWEQENPLVRKVFSFEEKSSPEVVITENWEEENPQLQREYSFEEKRRLKALVHGEEYDKWEKENRLWEIEDDLVPLNEDEDEEKQKATMRIRRRIEQLNSKRLTEEEERLKSYLEYLEKSSGPENLEQENPLVRKVFSFGEKSSPDVVITENWEEENPQVQREYSFEEKRRLKALVHGEEYGKWEKENRLWEIEDDLVPLNEDEEKQKATMRLRRRIEQLNSKPLTEEEERLKSYLEYLEKSRGPKNWEQENPLVRKVFSFEEKSSPEVVITENWEEENPQVQREYSFEEKRRLKALVDGEEYDKWEKENRLWEIEDDLVPLNEDEKQQKGILKFLRKIEKLNSRPLTEEEERIKQSHLENMERFQLGLPTGSWVPTALGRELAFYTGPESEIEKLRKAVLRVPAPAPGPAPLEERQTAPPTPAKECSSVSSCVMSIEEEREKLLAQKAVLRVPAPAPGPAPLEERQTAPPTPAKECSSVSSCVMSIEEEREKLLAQGRCLSGLFLTPYCQCDSHCCGRKNIPSKEDPPAISPILLKFKRQCRQSHYFDIDEFPDKPLGGVTYGAPLQPLEPSGDFNGKAELLMELANRAIQEYNAKECNVFKYEVKKIEKVNCSLSWYHQYWMTVKVLNLTLGTRIETFQIHAGISCYGDNKKIFCCRLKEEAIVGLPSCDFCYGLLSDGHVTGRREEAL